MYAQNVTILLQDLEVIYTKPKFRDISRKLWYMKQKQSVIYIIIYAI